MKLALSTRIKRLTTLAVMLEWIDTNTNRVRGFHLRAWKARNPRICRKSDRPTCGTAECAGGFIAGYPAFRALGVTAERSTGAPIFKGYVGFRALELLLGLNDAQTRRLFSPEYYDPTEHNKPSVVAGRVREVIAGLKAEERRAGIRRTIFAA